MSKQLTEEFQAKIKEWAAANAATEATTFDETRYVGIIDGAWWMAEQLVEAQERIRELEDVLQRLIDSPQPYNESEMWSWIHTARNIANEALSPNNKQKEDGTNM